jgi:hypothetical protein
MVSLRVPSLHDVILLAHSTLRWGVLAGVLWCLARAAVGWVRRRPFDDSDARVVRILTALVDTQLLLGLVLYGVLSPIGLAALGAPGMMGNVILRFFALEHPLLMITGVTVLHVGMARARRLGADPRRHRAVLLTTFSALVLFLFGVPWPGLPYARPLLRGGG